MITTHQVQQGSDEWKEARVGKYTGSNAYKLLSSFGATEYAKAINDSFTGNFHTERGHILEEEAVDLYETIKGVAVDRPGFVTNSVYPSCLYSPDGIHDDYLIEVKCFVEEKHKAISKGAITVPIMAQIHFGMLITGKRKGRLILYNPDINAKDALFIIEVRCNMAILRNFKRIIGGNHARV